MVFVSYSRTAIERRFVTALERCLRAAGLEVWRDINEIQPGDAFRQEIEDAVRRASWLLFLVSNSWLDSAECQNELTLAVKHHGGASRFVPLLRAPFERVRPRIPVVFKDLNLMAWTEDEPDPCSRLCELVSKLLQDRIPIEKWSEHGRMLASKAGVSLDDGRPPETPHLAEDPPSFHCNRSAQWTTVEGLMSSGRNELVVVRGATGEYHEHFLQRVEHALCDTPERSVVPVRWRRRPAGEDDYLRALAASLGTVPGQLTRTLDERLAYRHVVLVHECVRGDFDDEDLERYHAAWLPAVVAETRGRYQVKVVQAFEWPRTALLQKVLRLGLGGDPSDERDGAEALVSRIEAAPGALRVVRLRELEPITSEDLHEFCEAWVDPPHRAPLQDEVRKHGRTSEEILRSIDRYLLRVRRQHDEPPVVATVQR